MRILFLSAWYPYPATNGSKLRIYNLLRGLAAAHRVTLLTFTDEPVDETPPELASICEGTLAFRRRHFQAGSMRALLGLFSPMPRSAVATHHPEFAAALDAELTSGRYDLIIASQWDTAAYVLSTRQIPAIFEELELGQFVSATEQAASAPRRLRHQLTLLKLRWYLRRALPRFAACTVTSETERDLLGRFAPGYRRVSIVPNGVDVASYSAARDTTVLPQPDTLIYAGATTYSANYDAMAWFIQSVLPLVEARRPSVRLTITGAHGARPLPPSPLFQMTGFVDDIRPLVASSWVSLAPLRQGGGTRLKILESMALRTPVVATSKGMEGLVAEPGRHLLVADAPRDFADAVAGLLADRACRERLADAAYDLVRARYDWSAILPSLLDLVDRVGTTGSSTGRA